MSPPRGGSDSSVRRAWSGRSLTGALGRVPLSPVASPREAGGGGVMRALARRPGLAVTPALTDPIRRRPCQPPPTGGWTSDLAGLAPAPPAGSGRRRRPAGGGAVPYPDRPADARRLRRPGPRDLPAGHAADRAGDRRHRLPPPERGVQRPVPEPGPGQPAAAVPARAGRAVLGGAAGRPR